MFTKVVFIAAALLFYRTETTASPQDIDEDFEYDEYYDENEVDDEMEELEDSADTSELDWEIEDTQADDHDGDYVTKEGIREEDYEDYIDGEFVEVGEEGDVVNEENEDQGIDDLFADDDAEQDNDEIEQEVEDEMTLENSYEEMEDESKSAFVENENMDDDIEQDSDDEDWEEELDEIEEELDEIEEELDEIEELPKEDIEGGAEDEDQIENILEESELQVNLEDDGEQDSFQDNAEGSEQEPELADENQYDEEDHEDDTDGQMISPEGNELDNSEITDDENVDIQNKKDVTEGLTKDIDSERANVRLKSSKIKIKTGEKKVDLKVEEPTIDKEQNVKKSTVKQKKLKQRPSPKVKSEETLNVDEELQEAVKSGVKKTQKFRSENVLVAPTTKTPSLRKPSEVSQKKQNGGAEAKAESHGSKPEPADVNDLDEKELEVPANENEGDDEDLLDPLGDDLSEVFDSLLDHSVRDNDSDEALEALSDRPTTQGSQESVDQNEKDVDRTGGHNGATIDESSDALSDELKDGIKLKASNQQQTHNMENTSKLEGKRSQLESTCVKERGCSFEGDHLMYLESDNGDNKRKETVSDTADKYEQEFHKIQELLTDKKTDYESKIQFLEMQLVKLENQLLMENLSKSNSSMSFSKLENHILKLENELLRLENKFSQIKRENEILAENQQSTLDELTLFKEETTQQSQQKDYPVNFRNDISDVIATHQTKILELMKVIQDQSIYLHNMEEKSKALEDRNDDLQQRLLDQSLAMSELLKKLDDVSVEQLYQRQTLELALIAAQEAEKKSNEQEKLRREEEEKRAKAKAAFLKSKAEQDAKNRETGNKAASKDERPQSKAAQKPAEQAKKARVVDTKSSSKSPVAKTARTGKEDTLKRTGVPKEDSVKRPIDHKKDSAKRPIDPKEASLKRPGDPKTTKPESKSGATTAKNQQIKSVAKGKTANVSSTKNNPEKQKPTLKQTVAESRLKTQPKTKDSKVSQPSKSAVTKNTKSAAPKEGTKLRPKTEGQEVKQQADTKTTKKPQPQTSRQGVPQKVQPQSTKLSTKDQVPPRPSKQSGRKTVPPQATKPSSQGDRVQAKEGKQSEPDRKSAKVSTQKITSTQTPASKKSQEDSKASATKAESTASSPASKEFPEPKYLDSSYNNAKDCFDHYLTGRKRDTAMRIRPKGAKVDIDVWCDMKHGGWTTIQRRQDGRTDFFKDWTDYKKGFGQGVFGEHWLGLENIHLITNQGYYSLRVDLVDWERENLYAEYDLFLVEDEAEGYRLHISGYRGNAGDGFMNHSGMKFSTKDMDNDLAAETDFGGSCAKRFTGAWWYHKCYKSNLNGKYYKGGDVDDGAFDGISWKPWKGPKYSMKKAEMKIRPRDAEERLIGL